MIEIKKLEKEFTVDSENVIKVIQGINLQINENEFIGIIGSSGSGKSTLLNIIAGLLKPTKGEIYIDFQDVYSLTEEQLANHLNKNIGFIFQNFFLEPTFSVYENIIVPYIISHKVSKEEERKMREDVLSILEKVKLTDKVDIQVKKLSGGEKQRVAIGRALMNNPKYIFADEPTGNLDSKNGEMIMDLLKSIHNDGHTIILVTHNNDYLKYCDKYYTIKDGLIMEG